MHLQHVEEPLGEDRDIDMLPTKREEEGGEGLCRHREHMHVHVRRCEKGGDGGRKAGDGGRWREMHLPPS